MKWFERLKEPSTYAGLAGLALVLGFSNGDFIVFTNAVAGVFSTVAILLGEQHAN